MGHPILDVLRSQDRSLSWLARQTGHSASYVHRMVSGERPLTPDFKAKAADTLKVPESLLFPEQKAA